MSEQDYQAPEQLMADLQDLVAAGLLVEVRQPGQPSRYALSVAAREATAKPVVGRLTAVRPIHRPSSRPRP
jgi:hypothetical protein